MVADKVAAFLSDAHGLSEKEVPGSETSLLQSGLIDSLGMMELVAFLEQTFEVHIEDEDLVPENFETISAIARLVESKRDRDQ
jgi:acyl carrier protein